MTPETLWAQEARIRSNLESFRHHTEVWPELKPRRDRSKSVPRVDAGVLMEELEWLLGNGAMPWEAAQVLNRSQHSLSRMAYRRGLTRLGTIMLPEKSEAKEASPQKDSAWR